MRRGTWLSRAALLEEVELAKSQELISSACSHLPLAVPVLKTGESCRDTGRRNQWLFLLLSGNEAVVMWVTGIAVGPRSPTLSTGKLAHKPSLSPGV